MVLNRLWQALRGGGVTKVETGLPSTIGFSPRDGAPVTVPFGDVWFDKNVTLRGDVAFWLRALDRDTRKSLHELVTKHGATLRDGVLELRADRAETKRAALALAKRLADAHASSDDSALFAACKQGSQRERLTAVMLVRTQRADDPRTKALIAELDASTEPDVQMLADIAAARWTKIRGHADNTRFDDKLLAETVATLRSLYPKIDVGTGDARAQLRALCAVLV